MSIKLRSLITIITHIFLIKSFYSIVKGEPINLFFLLMGVIGISYLIITNDYYNEKQTKRNSRKILSNSGKLIEHPEFIKIFAKLKIKYKKKFNRIRFGILINYLGVLAYLLVAQYLFELPMTEKNNWMYFIIEKGIAIILWERAYKLYGKTQIIKVPYKQIYVEEFLVDFVKEVDSKLKFSVRKPERELRAIGSYLSNFFVEKGSVTNIHTEGIISGEFDGKRKFRMLNLHADRIFKELNADKYLSGKVDGLFSMVKTSTNTKGYLKIVSHKQVIDDFDRKIKVLLDSSEFERKYNVFAPNKIFAHRVLTPDIMEMLTKFGEYGIEFEVIIKDKFIFIKFYDVKLFEVNNWKYGLNRDDVYLLYCVIRFAYELTKKINKSLEGFIG